MRLHLVQAAARSKQLPRPAKVIALESRRKACLDLARPAWRRPRG